MATGVAQIHHESRIHRGNGADGARGDGGTGHANPLFLVLLVVVITAAGTAGEAVLGHVPGMKTWLWVGVITAIVVYAAGTLSRSRAAREE